MPLAPYFAGQFGGDVAAAVKYDYDPKNAKELLAEAGYSNGFDVEMLTYVQLTSWPAAVQNHLQAVRICAKINEIQVAPAIDKSHRGEAPLYMGSWGSYSINDVSAIPPVLFGKGAPRSPERRDPANPAPPPVNNRSRQDLGEAARLLYGGEMPVFTNPRRTPTFGVAPSLEDIEVIAAEALATIPEEFRKHVGNVRIQVDDFPSDEVEKAMDLETPFDVLGLYQGVSMVERGAGHVANDIDRIFLYRRPILDYWCESEEDLPHIVRHVLIHEIGHHFGLSDDDMEAIEAKAEEEAKRVRPNG